jgi:hypothetical protein
MGQQKPTDRVSGGVTDKRDRIWNKIARMLSIPEWTGRWFRHSMRRNVRRRWCIGRWVVACTVSQRGYEYLSARMTDLHIEMANAGRGLPTTLASCGFWP